MRNTTNDKTNIEKGSGDSKEDAIPNFVHDVSNMVGGSNVVNNSSNHSSVKRKREGAQHTTPQCQKKKRGTGIGAQLFTRLNRLVECVSMTRESTPTSRDKK